MKLISCECGVVLNQDNLSSPMVEDEFEEGALIEKSEYYDGHFRRVYICPVCYLELLEEL